ncbi:MAG: hypothetical protein PHC88_02800 [Terrimicrobiaceae bacterium]|nr:hypothetical protein [Terrimicrobiaceae bacterium]
MQRAVNILAVLFLIAAGLAAMEAVNLLAGFRQTRIGGREITQPHLFALSASLTYCWAFAAIYLSLAWSLWNRKRLKLVLFFLVVALFGFKTGAVLAVATLVLTTRPVVRGSFRDGRSSPSGA